MGESNCLLRSFSDTSCYAEEEDPIRALGESISFGRFLSESLAWEKWSAFSHNRYVEEAEKFSRPGSVAAKKAYFEAHFRRKAAEKAAAAEKASALIQEANDSSTGTSNAETRNENHTNLSIDIISKSDGDLAIIEQLDKDAVDYEVVDYTDTNDCKCDTEQIEVEISRVERAQDVPQPRIHTNEPKCDIEQSEMDFSRAERPEDLSQPCTDINISTENSVLVDKSNQFDNVEVPENIAVSKQERMHDQGTANQEKRSEMNSSTKLLSKTRTVKLSCSPAGKKAAGQTRYKINNALQSERSAGDSFEGKRPSARSLHMSINLSSRVGETSNTASVSEHNISKRTSPNFPRLPVASRTSIRASNGVFSNASANPLPEGRRTDRLINKSVSGVIMANGKLPLHSIEPIGSSFLKSSTSTTRGNARSPTVLSPFRFRSEERVAKRKEFFERMVEIKSKEAEKMQLQRRYKENTGHDYKKLRQSSGFKPKLNEDMNDDRLQSPSNQIRKQISLTQPRSPILGRKPNSSMGQTINSRNSWKPPISGNTSKHITEKTNQTTRHSPISTTTKNRQENASPNIRR